MTAPSGSSEPVSPFLAFVGPQDRSPLRLGLWLALGLPLAIFGLAFIEEAARSLGLVGPVQAGKAAAHPLLAASRNVGVAAFLELAFAAPLLGAARLAFQRPAWTFVTPARPFDVRLLLAGALLWAVLVGLSLGIDVLQGETFAPPIFDARQPLDDRLIYALASLPTLLLAAAAQELAFRGVVLQVAAGFIRTRIGLCVANGLADGLLFVLIHSQLSPLTFLDLAVTGAVFAYSVLELGGLEFSLGGRFALYAVVMILVQPTAGAPEAAFHWSDLMKPSALIDLGVTFGTALATVAAVRAIKRFRKP